MTSIRTIIISAVLFLGLLGTLRLEKYLANFVGLELFIVLVGLMFSFITIAGIAAEARWSWPLSTLLHAGLLANAAVVYVSTRSGWLAFLSTAFVLLFGLIVSVASISGKEEEFDFNDQTETKAEESTPEPRRRNRKKKST